MLTAHKFNDQLTEFIDEDASVNHTAGRRVETLARKGRGPRTRDIHQGVELIAGSPQVPPVFQVSFRARLLPKALPLFQGSQVRLCFYAYRPFLESESSRRTKEGNQGRKRHSRLPLALCHHHTFKFPYVFCVFAI
jgi:hypothetical protein